jgi:hypothetical protein
LRSSKAISILFGFFAGLLLLLIVSYLLVPFWATKLVVHLLQGSNVHLEQGEFSRPGPSRLEITNPGITYRNDADVFTVRAQKLVIDYSLESLFNGELLALQSEHVDVDHQQQHEAAEASPSSPFQGFPLLLPSEIFKRIPVKLLEIKKLTAKSPLLSDFGRLTGQLSFDQQALEVGFSGSRQRSLEFSFKVSRDNKVDLNLTESGQSIAIISSETEGEGVLSQIKTLAKVNLGRISLTAKEMGWLNKDLTVSGDLEAHWQMQLPGSLNKEMIKAATLTGEISSTGNLKFEKERIDTNFSLAATFKGHDQTVVVRLGQLNVSGSMSAVEQIVEALPAVKAACLKNRDCVKFMVKAFPDTELVIDSESKALITKKGGLAVTVGINQAINKSGKAVDQTKGLLARTELKTLSYQWSDDWQFKGEYEASLAAHSLIWDDLQSGEIEEYTAGSFAVDQKKVNLRVNADSRLVVQNIMISDGLIPSLVIRNSNDLDLTIADGRVDLPSSTFDFNAPDLAWDDQLFQMQAGLITLKKGTIDFNSPGNNSVHADMVLSGVVANKKTVKLSPLTVKSGVNLEGNLVLGQFEMQDQSGIVRFDGEFEHNQRTGRGKMETSLQPITFREDKTYLPKLLENWKHPLDLSAGTLSASTHFVWDDKQSSTRSEITLKGVGGFYNRNIFKNINGLIRVDGPADALQVQRQTMTVASINVGIPIKNIEFTVFGSLDALTIENLQAELLGGKASQKIMIYRQSDPENKINLRLDAIQLSEILKLQPAITGEGQLNGDLPLRLLGSGVEMNGGKIVSDSGGVIRYQPDAPVPDTVSNSGVKLALDALNNFRYDVMEIDADYAVTGDLLLKARLEGRNPDLKIKRPFHFNLQVRQNIPALMKSLQLTQEISDSIDVRVKNFYQR